MPPPDNHRWAKPTDAAADLQAEPSSGPRILITCISSALFLSYLFYFVVAYKRKRLRRVSRHVFFCFFSSLFSVLKKEEVKKTKGKKEEQPLCIA